MARKRQRGRIYWRERGGVRRAYADLRDLGGGREALIPPGESLATSDLVVAEKLTVDRLQELQARLRDRVLLGVERRAGLKEFAAHHLVEKARAGKVTEKHLERTQLCLQRAVEFFGAERELTAIRPTDVGHWVTALREFVSPISKRPLGDQSIRQHLAALSNLFRRAQSDGCVLPGYNPVASLMDKPTSKRREARWLEVHEGALLLESARTHRPALPSRSMGHLYPMIATFVLTGGRASEVFGLEVEDVSFDRRIVTFRPNQWRRLKTATSHRSVRLWPQLEQILREYVFGRNEPLGSLLFPSVRGTSESMGP